LNGQRLVVLLLCWRNYEVRDQLPVLYLLDVCLNRNLVVLH